MRVCLNSGQVLSTETSDTILIGGLAGSCYKDSTVEFCVNARYHVWFRL